MKKINVKKAGKKTLAFILMLIVGVVMFYLIAFVLSPDERMSIYPAAILKIYVGLLMLVYMDKIHHANIDTQKAIADNNTTYGLIILAYAAIIAAVMNSI